MTDKEKESWTDGEGKTQLIVDIDDDHLKNIYGVLSQRKEKTMQYFNVRKELRRRGLK